MACVEWRNYTIQQFLLHNLGTNFSAYKREVRYWRKLLENKTSRNIELSHVFP
jgi:hypothetical protein